MALTIAATPPPLRTGRSLINEHRSSEEAKVPAFSETASSPLCLYKQALPSQKGKSAGKVTHKWITS